MDLRDKVALVTGAGGVRVGREIARRLAARGARVAVHYRSNRAGAEAVCGEIRAAGGDAAPFQADLAEGAACRALVAEVAKSMGALDALVSNASNFLRTPLAAATEREWDLTFDVNLRAPFLLAQAAAPHLGARGAREPGRIVNIADVQAYFPRRDWVAYCVSKAALISLTRALARALAPEVLVNAVVPGPVLLAEGTTPEEAERALARVPLGRTGDPSDVAAAVLFLIEGSDYVTGAALPVDGGRAVG